jgi:hypothetical protein
LEFLEIMDELFSDRVRRAGEATEHDATKEPLATVIKSDAWKAIFHPKVIRFFRDPLVY